MVYTPTGPFTNNSAPGLTAPFFNNIENWITLLDNAPQTTLTGSTSGTMVISQPLQGTSLKLVIFKQNNYKNGATSVSYTLPRAFTTGFLGIHTDVVGIIFKNGGTTQNVDVFTSAGNDNPGQGSAQPWLWFQCNHPVDTIVPTTANAGASTGWGFYIGI